MIIFNVEDSQGFVKTVEVPEDISLSLMEVLKASEYSILATCGGMALCATCHVEILNGNDKITSPNEAELDMMDTLPNAGHNSRLACQIRINENLNGALIKLMDDSGQ